MSNPNTNQNDGITLTALKMYPTFKKELVQSIDHVRQNGGHLKLVGILGTGKDDARVYASFTQKSCEALNIEFELRTVGQANDPNATLGDGVEEAIVAANDDDNVGGILVYYPIFGGTQDQYLQQVVSPLKDVEGLNHKFLYNMYHNIRNISPVTLRPPKTLPTAEKPNANICKSILPCTPLAIVKTLEYTNIYNPLLPPGDRARGKCITVINRSEVVGRPLAALLANDGARVLSADITGILEYSKRPTKSVTTSKPSSSVQQGDDQVVESMGKLSTTTNTTASSISPSVPYGTQTSHVTTPVNMTLKEAIALSDVVVSAVPGGKFKVETNWLKDGVVCVDIAGEKNFESDVTKRASIYIPAVGKLTIAMLQRNLIRLRTYQEVNKRAMEAAEAAGLM